MSTTGKVLVVLVTLALLGWLVLFSMEAKYHLSWSEHFDEVKKPIPDLQDQIAKAKDLALQTKAEIDRVQRQGIDELNLRDVQRENAELLLTELKETITRVKIQVERAESTEQLFQAILTRNVQERDETRQKRDAARADADAAIAANKASVERLNRLRGRFKTMTAESRRLERRLERMVSSGPDTPGPTTTPAPRGGALSSPAPAPAR